MRFTRIFILSLLVTPVAASRPCLAADLEWKAPSGCPDQETVEHRLRQALGAPLKQAPDTHCVARVEQSADGKWHLSLELTDNAAASRSEPQRRRFESDSCERLAETAAVALALALGQKSDNPERGVLPNGTAPDASTAREPATQDALQSEPPSAATPQTKTNQQTSARSPFFWTAQLQALLDVGTLPSVSPGAGAGAMFGYQSMGIRVSGLLLPERQSSATDPGGDFQLLAAELALCGLAGTGRRYWICAGAEVGQLSAEGVNVTRKQRGSSLWVAPSIHAAWSLRLSDGVALLVSGGVVTPLVRKSFEIRNFGEVHRPNSLVWRLGLGLQFDWH